MSTIYGEGFVSDRMARCHAHGTRYPWTLDCPECVKDARAMGVSIDHYYTHVRPYLRASGTHGVALPDGRKDGNADQA